MQGSQLVRGALTMAVLGLLTCAGPARSQAFSLTDGDAQLDIDFTDPILQQTLTVDGVSISGESGHYTGFPPRWFGVCKRRGTD